MDTAAAFRSPQDPAVAGPGAARPGGSVTALVRPVEHPLGHLDLLESLAIFIIREVAAESERPVLLFSGGKDSAVLLHLAAKAFKPGKIPFPVLHVDTGHNFSEVLDVPGRTGRGRGRPPHCGQRAGLHRPGPGRRSGPDRRRAIACRRRRCSMPSMPTGSTPPSAAPAGTRTRPGPRSGSSPSATRSGSGIPKRSDRSCGSSIRAACARVSTCAPSRCPTGPSSTSGSTSGASASSCLRSTTRTSGRCVERDGMLLAISEWVSPEAGEEVRKETVRFRTVGDATCTGAVRSSADTVEEIIREVSASQDLRARSDPGRRPLFGDRDGRPQARGVLLDP